MMSSSTSGGAQLGTRSVPFTPITRQNSIFSLTLDEFQNSIEPGKHFGSMNMDEFLKNVWSAEESQAMTSALNSSNDSNASQAGGQATGSGLVRQGSLTHPGSLSLSRTLSRKTVDEVWRDIHRVPEPSAKEQRRTSNYGEMTLEDFLVKAGVVREDSEAGSPASNNTSNYTASYPAPLASQNPFHGSSTLVQSTHQATIEAIAHNQHQQQIEWHNYQLKSNAMQQQQHVLQQQAQEAAAYAMPKRGPVITIPGTPSGSGLEGSSDGGLQVNGLSPAITTPDTPNRGRKRGLEALPEKTVERRQRRMIKNRESAARSRARKQAYTVELESEVTQLKDENNRLKRENEEHAKRRRQELLELPPEKLPTEKYPVLRRSRTISW